MTSWTRINYLISVRHIQSITPNYVSTWKFTSNEYLIPYAVFLVDSQWQTINVVGVDNVGTLKLSPVYIISPIIYLK